MPTERQILGAKINAAANKYDQKQRVKVSGGGYTLPPTDVRNKHLAELFGIAPRHVSFFLTYSRSCTHSFDAGACDSCPPWDSF